MLEETVFDQDGLTGTWFGPFWAEWAEGPHTVQC